MPINVGDSYGGGIVYKVIGDKAQVVTLSDVAHAVRWRDAAQTCTNYATDGGSAGVWLFPTDWNWVDISNPNTLSILNNNTNFTQFTPGSIYWTATCYGSCDGGYSEAFYRVFRSATSSDSGLHRIGWPHDIRCVREVPIKTQ